MENSFITHGEKQSKSDTIRLIQNGVEITDTESIVNVFADYFGKIGDNLESNLRSTDFSPYQNIAQNPHTFALFPVSSIEIMKIISKLKLTGTHIDVMPVKIFKSIKEFVCDVITNLINSSFFYAVFPSYLKLAKITPLYKKNDKKTCSNYRPISSLNYIS